MREPWFYKFARPIVKAFIYIAYRPTIIGAENIPKDGRLVLAGNHTNNFDCLLLIACTKRMIHFLAKDSLYKGYKKILFKNMGIIPVNRQIHDSNVLKTAKAFLEDDKVVGVFPEGTINRTEDIIMPFKIGAVKMAHDTDATIVPFTITGKYKLWNNKLVVTFYKPYKTKSDDLERENQILMNKVREGLEGKTK